MGFSCYLCREPFVEKGYDMLKGGGDGHNERPVSATKCGHLFHTDCLKNAFLAQGSTTAWATKLCPVCKQTLQLTDIQRVHASPFDSPAVEAQRNAADDMRKFNQKLKQENEGLLKRLEILYIQIRDIQSDATNLRREKQDLSHVLDQVRRINSMNVSEMESLRRENEKLKNIIVTLTEKLTSSHFGQENGNTGAGHYVRNDFADQQQQFSGRGFDYLPVTMNNINLCNGAPMKIGNPPGFSFPRAISSDNGADCQSSQESHARLSISPDDEANCVGVIGSGGPPRMCRYNNYYGLEEPVANQLDLDNNLEEMSKHLLRLTASATSTSNEACKAQVANGLNFTSVSGTRKSTDGDDASAISSFIIGSHKDENGEHGNQELKDEPNTSGSATSANFNNDYNSEDDDNADSDNSGKWLEKKSRRRTHSKGDRIKSEMQFDKKLYGSFLCPTCKARWGSSQSVLNKAQTCRYCKTEVHPYNQGPILSRKQLEMYKQDSASKKELGQNK
ncbi:unnamed protein product [Orchesella dallaii]|uniref:RING-type domain-containing protein n=1 Tax=Orchesella dallaii TaxID=48710 RepID=A0ABP1PUS6_9HEXA